jgi:hypothetical protein
MQDTAPNQVSLMDMSVGIAPWTHIKQVRLVGSTIHSQYQQPVVPTDVKYSINALTTVDRESKQLIVRALLMSCAVSKAESGEAEEVLRIEAEFLLSYSYDTNLPREITDEEAGAFGKMNGIHNAWPYWREYVQSTTARLGFPPLTLPLMTGTSLLQYYADNLHAH